MQTPADLFGYVEMFYNAWCRHSPIGSVSPVVFEWSPNTCAEDFMRHIGTTHLLLIFTLLATVCGANEISSDENSEAVAGNPPAPVLHADDLAGIRARGVLRVLVESDHIRHLPRKGDPLLKERDLAQRFAESLGLEMQVVALDTFSRLLPALQDGLGDIVAANLTVTPARQESVSFTVPLDRRFEMLVLAKGRDLPEEAKGLTGKLGVRAGSSFEQTSAELLEMNPQLEIVTFPGNIGAEALLDSVVTGSLDYTIQDSNRLTVFLSYRNDFQVGPPVSTERSLAWAVRQNSPALLEALNGFLHVHRILGHENNYVADLSELRKKRNIRMITRNNAATYFLWRGRLMGFEYDMATRFAKKYGMQLEVVVAPTHADLLPMLRSGEGDFVAAFMTPTTDSNDSLVTFSNPNYFASEVVVGRASESPMNTPADLAGRRIAVRRSSAYWRTLEEIRAGEGIEFEIVEIPESMETESVIAAVADGLYELTVADSHLLELEMSLRDDIQGLLQLKGPTPRAWAVQPRNTELLKAINDFLDSEYRSEFYNIANSRYFDRPAKYESGWDEAGADEKLSPYDDLVREFAQRYGFDWRLIVSQMYQESRFKPQARSWAGAVGLMQVMPRTGKELGAVDLEDPRVSVETGLRYLKWVWERFPNRLDHDEHMWFALASYNAGHGHVRDARRLAAQLELDPDVWMGNVELAMLKLAEPEYSRHARHGYVRGTEPVAYVRHIRERYRAYVDLLDRE
ncbi:MAG: lytic transglycosylase F [Verrucomicrobia bacterium]|nr:MAG: lytic transglycosylase F [Verrucomicrobiota bacterium]